MCHIATMSASGRMFTRVPSGGQNARMWQERIRGVSLAAEGELGQGIASREGVSRPAVLMRRKWFEEEMPDTPWRIRSGPGGGSAASRTRGAGRSVGDALWNRSEGRLLPG